ncbi:MAG: XdhC family protein [Myxococcales bacterium]|nr:XdhC family protein [Myxococcales bacterium]
MQQHRAQAGAVMDADGVLFQQLVSLRQQGRACVLCTVVRTAGSTPRKRAARMLVSEHEQWGTIGGGRVEKQILDAARALLGQGEAAAATTLRYHLTRELGMCCGGEMEVLVEPMIPAPFLVICGGGHIAQALVPLAVPLGFVPILVEDLEELGNPERFPQAARIVDSFDPRDWRDLPLDRRCYVVIVTRDHQVDQALLEALLPYDLAYLGLIGSERKVRMFRQRLINKGAPSERLDRVFAPIGLDIGAETPEEIALAIAAELVRVRAARRKEAAAHPMRAVSSCQLNGKDHEAT